MKITKVRARNVFLYTFYLSEKEKETLLGLNPTRDTCFSIQESEDSVVIRKALEGPQIHTLKNTPTAQHPYRLIQSTVEAVANKFEPFGVVEVPDEKIIPGQDRLWVELDFPLPPHKPVKKHNVRPHNKRQADPVRIPLHPESVQPVASPKGRPEEFKTEPGIVRLPLEVLIDMVNDRKDEMKDNLELTIENGYLIADVITRYGRHK